MRRLLVAVFFVSLVGLAAVPQDGFAQCEGSSGTATINTSSWTAECVLAAVAPDCVDSLGNTYECFEIVGISNSDPNYGAVSIYLLGTPVQGQTYELGGANENGGMVVGETTFAVTGSAPYTGQATINVFNTGSGTFDCTFHFKAQSLFFGPDVDVVDGHFSGTIVAVEPTTWTDFKSIYR